MNDKTLQEMIRAEDSHPWYRARLKLVEIWATRFLPQDIGVDIGCGSGAAAQLLQDRFHLNVTGYDIAPYAVDASLKRGVKTIQADVTSLKIADDSQDFVVSLDVIEHIENRFVLLNEIHRILKPGAVALITVPAHMWLWSNHDVLNHHHRRYSKKQLTADLIQSGFEISTIRWWNSILLPYIYLTRLARKGSDSSEFESPPRALSSIVFRILNFESKSKLTGFLIGVSLVAEVRKDNPIVRE